MNKQPRMTNEEAIEVIKNNYPPENYTMLREALDIAIETLGKVDPIPLPTIKPGDKAKHSDLGQVRIMSEPTITVLKDKDQYEAYLSDLELIPNE